jgi:hypothetical protein
MIGLKAGAEILINIGQFPFTYKKVKLEKFPRSKEFFLYRLNFHKESGKRTSRRSKKS